MKFSSNDQSCSLRWGVERQKNFECGLQHAFGIHTKMRIRSLKPLPQKLSNHDLTWPWKINALVHDIYDEKCGVAEIEQNKYLSSQINFMVFLGEEPLGSISANE